MLDDLIEGGQVPTRTGGGGLEAEELEDALAVLRVLDGTDFESDTGFFVDFGVGGGVGFGDRAVRVVDLQCRREVTVSRGGKEGIKIRWRRTRLRRFF